MRKQLTVILILLNLVVLAVFYLFERGGAGKKFEENNRKIFGEEAVDIDYIRISGDSLGPDRVLKKQEKNWVLTSPIEWPANFYAVSRILNHITFLEKETSFSVEEIEAAGRNLASYGLEEPQLRLEFGKGIARTAISIGSTTEIGNRLYILSPNQNEILVIKRGLFDSLLVDMGNLQSQSVFDIPLFEVQTLSLQKSFPTPLRIRITRVEDDWRFETPFQTGADKTEVETVINGLNSLNVQSFVANPEPDLSIYGLASPRMRLTMEGENKRKTILIGEKVQTDEGDSLYYAKGSENETVFTIPVLLFDQRLNNAQEELRDRNFVKFDADLLRTIEISQSDRTVSLQKLETGDWQIMRREDDGRMTANAADNQTMEEMITTLTTLRAQNFVSDAPSNADLENYGFTDPQRIIYLKGENTNKLMVGDLVDDNPRHAYAKLEHEPFIYEIDNSILAEFHTRPYNYQQRVLHKEPEGAKLVGLTIRKIENDSIIYNAVLNEVTPTWEAIATADELNEEGTESLLAIVAQSKSVEAGEFIEEAFGNVPWKFRLDLLFESETNKETPVWTTEIWVTERISGTKVIAGLQEKDRVFYANQPFTDAFFDLSFSRFDPGPEPEPVDEPGSNPSAIDPETSNNTP